MYNKKDVHSMARKQRLMIRLTDDEKQRLEYAAKRKGVSMSKLIQITKRVSEKDKMSPTLVKILKKNQLAITFCRM